MSSSKYCELYWVCTVSFCETLTTGLWKVFLYRVGINAHGRVVTSSVSFVCLLLQCLQVTFCIGPTVPTNCVQTVHRKTWTLVGTLTSSVRALTTHRLALWYTPCWSYPPGLDQCRSARQWASQRSKEKLKILPASGNMRVTRIIDPTDAPGAKASLHLNPQCSKKQCVLARSQASTTLIIKTGRMGGKILIASS